MAAPPRTSLAHSLPIAGGGMHAFAISKSDTAALAYVTTAIYVGGTGDLVVIAAGDDPTGNGVTFKSVPVGAVIPVAAAYVLDATTATNLVGIA